MAMINNAMTSDLKRSPFNLVSSLYLLQLLVNKFGAGKEVLSEGMWMLPLSLLPVLCKGRC